MEPDFSHSPDMYSSLGQAFGESFMSSSNNGISPNSIPAQMQSQSQWLTIPPPVSNQVQTRRYTATDWDDQRQEITRLYESGTLESVMRIMKERHGLEATPKMYKDRIKKWGLNKNIQPVEMEAIIRKQRERILESSKPSAFRVRKRPVPQGRIDRYIKEHVMVSIVANNQENNSENITLAATPEDISCYTPSDTGPLTPNAPPSPRVSSHPRAPAHLEALPVFRVPARGSYQFGDPVPTLPSSPLVPQKTSGFQEQSLSSMPITASPTFTFSAFIDLDEASFDDSSSTSPSVPLNPRPHNLSLLQGGAMQATHGQARSQWPVTSRKLMDQHSQNTRGREHPATLNNMRNLAPLFYDQSKYTESEIVYRQTLQSREKVLGLEHPHTLVSMNNLAGALREKGKLIEAEDMHQQTLRIREKVLGLEHPDTLTSMNNLAGTLRERGKLVEAEEMHQQNSTNPGEGTRPRAPRHDKKHGKSSTIVNTPR